MSGKFWYSGQFGRLPSGSYSGSGFTGSFYGDGSNLTGVAVNWANVSSKPTGLVSGSTISGSFSGSFQGDGSNLTGISSGGPTRYVARNISNFGVVNTTTLQNVPGMVVSVTETGSYYGYVMVKWDWTDIDGIPYGKVGFSYSGTWEFAYADETNFDNYNGSAYSTLMSSGWLPLYGSTGTSKFIVYHLHMKFTTTGSLQLQFAQQNLKAVSVVTCYTGSFFEIKKMDS